MTLKMQALRRSLTITSVLLGLAGCAGQQLSADGMKLIQEGQTEKGLAMLARASEMEPTNSQLRVRLSEISAADRSRVVAPW